MISILSSCEKKPENPETLFMDSELKSIDSQLKASKLLFDFYNNSEKTFEFYEVICKSCNFTLNYTPNKKVLSISTDICSGWSSQYSKVGLKELKMLRDSNFIFQNPNSTTFLDSFGDYPRVLNGRMEVGKWEKVRTNGCGGY